MRSYMPAQKVALVTGSGKKRVGWHVADALAARGYALALHYRSSATETAETVATFKDRGVEVTAFQADLSDELAVRTMVQQVISRFGRIDVLVNCAAIWKSKKLEETTADDVRVHF